jgi:hypothetical protein
MDARMTDFPFFLARISRISRIFFFLFVKKLHAPKMNQGVTNLSHFFFFLVVFRGSGFAYWRCFFGTDFTDYAVLLCLGQDFAFYLNAFGEVYQKFLFITLDVGAFQLPNFTLDITEVP